MQANAFRTYLRVRYAECDAQEVVFNARYGDYMDVAFTEFQRHAIGGYEQLTNAGLDNQVVKLTIEWRSSARFDDIIACDVHVSHVGNTSYTLQIVMTDYPSGREIASGEAIYVVVDSTEFGKTPIPDWLREKLLQGATGVVVNQSGVAIDA